MLKSKERIEWIDIAKGVGIIYVMFSHIQLIFFGKNILSFFIPLFFILSGYTFSLRNNINFKSFIKKIFKSLIIPYISMTIILYLIYLCKIIVNLQLNIKTVILPILGSIYSRYYIYDIHAVSSNVRLLFINNEALWFLPCLFISEVILYFIINQNNKKSKYLILILCILIGYLFDAYCKILMPWSIDSSFIYVIFLWIGYRLKEINLISRNLSRNKIILLFAFIGINTIFIRLNSEPNTSIREYGNYIYFYISALSGVGLQIIICQCMEKVKLINKVFSYIGKNSLIILGFHLTFYSLISYLASILNIEIKSISYFGVIYVGLTLLILIPIINIVNYKFSWILGKNGFNKTKINNEYK